MDEVEDASLILSVSLPATYPKTLPKLSLSFSEIINQKIQSEAQHILRTKPRMLLGTEMIFEIATLLQDILDQEISQTKAVAVRTLDEERMIQEAANAQKVQKGEDDRQKEQAQARLEEEHILLQMMEHERTRLAKRRSKVPNLSNDASNEDEIPGSLSFDQSVPMKSPKGAVIMLRTIHSKIQYKEGPTTIVSTVQPWVRREEDNPMTPAAPFLVLQECRIDSQKNEEMMKKHIQNLESKLDRLKNLGQ